MIGGGNGNNSDECACFYMAGPTHRIKGKKVTKRNGMVTTEGARAFFFIISFKYSIQISFTWNTATRDMHKRAKEITHIHTHTNTYRWKNERNVARTKKKLWTNKTVFFYYFTEIVVNNPRTPLPPPPPPQLPLPTSISYVLRVLYIDFFLSLSRFFSVLYFERVQVDDDGAAGTDVID